MSASTQDIFGNSTAATPATPGSYGEAPRGYRLPAVARPGLVRLQIADLARSLSFYEGTLGMRVLSRDGTRAVLGAEGSDAPLVELHEKPGALPAPKRGRLGLYHFAILLPDRASLGRFVRHLAEIGARAGAGDHLVSEAFYLQDPDNLGIEVYADRPQASWRRVGRELMMATDPVDTEAIVRAAGDAHWTGMPAGTVIGHVHLHVGDLADATAFYSEALGFDRMVWQYPGALFLAAGGYHHHLGTNTWAGVGATSPSAQDAGLLEWTIEVPATSDVADVAQSLERAGYPMSREELPGVGAAIVTRDPWGTQVRVSVRSPRVA
jgi:catechol 2,3-dioxygenase